MMITKRKAKALTVETLLKKGTYVACQRPTLKKDGDMEFRVSFSYKGGLKTIIGTAINLEII